MKFNFAKLEERRIRSGDYGTRPGEPWGAFLLWGPCGETLLAIVNDGVHVSDKHLGGWEHCSVSIHHHHRLPNWREMCFVKDLFWGPEECVVQYHPPASEYVNNVANVLHLWRPVDGKFPMPPSILVGVKEVGEFKTKADAERARELAARKLSGL